MKIDVDAFRRSILGRVPGLADAKDFQELIALARVGAAAVVLRSSTHSEGRQAQVNLMLATDHYLTTHPEGGSRE